jgi:hypothetical protein
LANKLQYSVGGPPNATSWSQKPEMPKINKHGSDANGKHLWASFNLIWVDFYVTFAIFDRIMDTAQPTAGE